MPAIIFIKSLFQKKSIVGVFIKRAFVLLFLSLFTAQSFSQSIPDSFKKTTDSLIKAAPATYRNIDAGLRKHRRDTLYMQYFSEKAEKEGYWNGLAYSLNQIGTKYRNISQHSKAIAYHQKALEVSKKAKSKEFEIFSLNMMGVVYRRSGAVKIALDYNQEALGLAETIENPSNGIKRSINVSLNSIGNIYQELKQYDLAIDQFTKSMKLEEELGNKLGLAINHQNIGECLEDQGKLDEALESYKTALAYDVEVGSEIGKVICNNSIAQVYIKQNKPQDALHLLEPALIASNKTGDKHITSSVLITMGWALMQLNQYGVARENLTKGLEMSKTYDLTRNISTAYGILSQLANKQGDYKNALSHYQQAEFFNEKITNDVNLRYVNDMIIKYESEKKNTQIEELAKENENVRLRLRRNNTTLLISGLALLLLAGILYILYRQYQLNNEKKVLTLEQSMLRSQMNPHFLFNSLNSIKLYIINNEKKNAVHYLNKFSKLVRKILEASSMKEISLAEELETVELYMNIENIRFSNEIDFKITIEDDINPHNIKIPSLILQPFLENAIWHGLSSKEGQKKITLHISKENQWFTKICITDNGVGREMAEKIKENKILKRKSVGIDITKERLANFSKDYQNSFDVKMVDLYDNHNKPSGTMVILDIPTI